MPTRKKRINLTVPEEIYKKIQKYRTYCGIQSDAAGCMQMITRQLKEERNGENT